MKKTRLLMLVGVALLSLALVGIALAADNAQKPNPPVQVAFTGLAPSNINSLSGSHVFFDPSAGGDTCYIPGAPQTFCFTSESFTNDWEYVYNTWVKFPSDWTVTNVYVQGTPVCDGGGTWGDLTWSFETSPYEVNIYHPRYQAYTDHCLATYCVEAVPGGPAPFALESWYYDGDGYNYAPHHPCSDDIYTPPSMSGEPCDEFINPQASVPVCNLDPGVYLNPPVTQAAGCNGIPQVHQLSLFNNTGADGTFAMTYTAPLGMATLTGPDTIDAIDGQTVQFDVTLTPNVCNFDPIVATIDTEGNGYAATATINKNIVNVPTFETVPASAPSWAGFGYPRDGCTAMNAAGEWVSYQLGDMSSYSGFWGYNTATNTWFQVGAANTPADRWAPDWAYDPDTNLCYVTGGANTPGGGTYNDAYVFDPVANAFTQLGNFTSIRDFHTSWVGTIDGVKYLCIGGGVNAASIIQTSTQCYDLAQPTPGVWNGENAQIPVLPTDPFGSADGVLHATTGDQFWYVGGAINNFATVTDEARYFDDADNAWHFAGNTGFPRYRVEGDFFKGDFYQLGGSTGGFTPTSEVVQGHFDGVSWVWTLLDNLANIRMDNIVGITENSVWSIDGYGAASSDYVEFAQFCPLCTGPLQAEKTATDMTVPGGTIDYSITIFNTSAEEVFASMVDAIPAGTTYVPGSVSCNFGTCLFDGGLNAITWAGTVGPASGMSSGNNIDSLSGSFVYFDPSIGGDAFFTPGEAQTFCFHTESFTTDYAYVYYLWQKFPADWNVTNAYVQGTPSCTNGYFGSFSWAYGSGNNEIELIHSRYQSPTDHCYANYCFDVISGSYAPGALESWYWSGDDYGNPPDHPCSNDVYTPSGWHACDEAIYPQALIPVDPDYTPNPVTISFQVTAGGTCPDLVTNTAVVSSEGNPDVLATAETNVYCSLEPDIAVSPLSLTQELLPNQTATQQLQICNNGPTPLDWSLLEIPGLKVTSVTPAPAPAPMLERPVTLSLEANNTSGPTAPAPAVPNADVSLILDDGTRENDIGIGGTLEFLWANRFTPDPAEFPFVINQVQIYFSAVGLVNVGDNIRLVFYENTSGNFDPAVGSNFLTSFDTTVQALDQWNVYNLPSDVTFLGPTGDAIIGVIGLEVPGSSYWPASIDQTVSFQRSWAGWYTVSPPPDPPFLPPDADWTLIDAYFPGNWMVRGFGHTLEGIPWLSEVPTSGTVPGFACTFVGVTFDSTGLAPGTFFGVLDVNSNDPDTPVVPVDVTLNVLAAPDITVTPSFLESTLFPDQTETQDLEVCNVGEANLNWTLTEIPGLKVNSVTPSNKPAATPTRQVALTLDADNIAGPTAPAPKVITADVDLVLDDGSRDNDIGIGGTLEFIWVNRFTPAPDAYPFNLDEVWVYFSSIGLVNVGDNIKLVMYENTSGNYDPAIGSNFLASYTTTVMQLDAWNVYVLPSPVAYNGPGDAIVGVIGLEVPGSSYWPASIDQTATQARSWAGWWTVSPPPDPPLLPPDADWTLIDAYFPGNWMVRGYGSFADALPWVSEVPTEGTLGMGECVTINVTFDSAGLAPGTYGGSFDIASNDPDTPNVIVPVTLNVLTPPTIVVTPSSLSLDLFPNETGTQTFNIENIGDADLDWSAAPGAVWLSVDPAFGTLVPGASVDVTATFDSTGLSVGDHVTEILITSNDPANPEVSLPATLTVNPLDADLAIAKEAPDLVRVGNTFTYTINVSNAGPMDAIGVVVVDTLPDLVSFVSASAGCVEAAGVVTCDVGDLAMDATATITIVVKADVEGIATNEAEVSSDFVLDPDLTNNTVTVDTEIAPAMYFFYLPIVLKTP